jgi:hypothetical protein
VSILDERPVSSRYPAQSSSMPLTTRHRLALSLILVGSFAVFGVARIEIVLAATRHAVLVGVVLPRHVNPGERISGSLVSHPNDYKSIPGLIVAPVEMELPIDKNGKPELDNAFVDTGNGRSRGDRRFIATVPADGSPLELTCGSGEVTRKARFDFEPQTEKPTMASYTMQPIAPSSGVSMIHGFFDGDSDRTDVRVNETRAKVVAESNDAAFYLIPSSSVNGRNRVTLTQNGKTYSWDMYQPDVEIGATKTILEQDESTNFKVTVNLEGLPAKDWRPGDPSDLYDTTRALASAPELGGNSRGLMVVTVKNKSIDTVSMAPSDRFSVPVTDDDRVNGSKEIDGTVTAKRAGGFEIDASLVSMLADVPGREISVPRERLASAEESPTPENKPRDEGDEGRPTNEGVPVANPTPTETPLPTTGETEKTLSEPTDKDQKQFTSWWAAFFGYGVAPELDAKTLTWWRARQVQQAADAKHMEAVRKFKAAEDAAINSDPKVKDLKATIINLDRTLNNPMIDQDPNYKRVVSKKKAEAEADLKIYINRAKENFEKTKEAKQLNQAIKEAARDAKSASDETANKAKDVPEHARNAIDEAEKQAGKNPSPAEAQEKVIER